MPEQTLTDDDLTRLSAALTSGKNPTVYIVDAVPGLGLAPGTSARIQSVDGSTVTVKPAGVDDRLPFEARELRATKSPRPVVKAKTRQVPQPARSVKSVAITIHVAMDNTASVAVTQNAARPTAARPIPIAAVQKALAGLSDKEAAKATEQVLSAARDAAADRVTQLQAELTAARKSLASIDRAKRTTGHARRPRGNASE